MDAPPEAHYSGPVATGEGAQDEREVLFEHAGFTATLCITAASQAAAERLRYAAYVASGDLEAAPQETLRDDYDGRPNARTHLLWREGRPVASVRSGIWSARYDWAPTEAAGLFEADLRAHVGDGAAVLESNRFAVEPGLGRRLSMQAQLLLFRIQDLSCRYDDCRHIVTAVRPRHARFYERMLGFVPISETPRCSWLGVDVVLLATTPDESRATVTAKGMPPATDADADRYAAVWTARETTP